MKFYYIIEILNNTTVLFHNSDYILYVCNRFKYKNRREENPIQSNFEKKERDKRHVILIEVLNE